MSTLIRAEQLSKRYKNKIVVDNLNFEVESNAVFGFLGPNGAGKTTTIRMLLGLVKPTTGNAFICGYNVESERQKIARAVGAIVENPTFFTHLTALENLRTFADYCNLTKNDREHLALLDKCGILAAAHQKVKSFSLGMRQRLGIAVALLNDPKVIFLDEPTNGLDPSGIAETRKLLRNLVETENRTVFLSSHLLAEVEQVCDAVAVLVKGQIKASGAIKDLLGSNEVIINARPFQKAFNALKTAFPQFLFRGNNETQTISVNGEIDLIPLIVEKLVQEQIKVYAISEAKQNLEEFFTRITDSSSI